MSADVRMRGDTCPHPSLSSRNHGHTMSTGGSDDSSGPNGRGACAEDLRVTSSSQLTRNIPETDCPIGIALFGAAPERAYQRNTAEVASVPISAITRSQSEGAESSHANRPQAHRRVSRARDSPD